MLKELQQVLKKYLSNIKQKLLSGKALRDNTGNIALKIDSK
jgi:hypothetical protein